MQDSNTKQTDNYMKGFDHYLGIIMSPPEKSFQIFKRNVKNSMKKPPFDGLLDKTLIDGLEIRPEAAYLYDAVMLYVQAVNELESRGLDYKDGELIVNSLLGTSYLSAMGFKIQIDDNGDAEGNYTLIYKKSPSSEMSGLFPIGRFYLNQSGSASDIPFLKLSSNIEWPDGEPPLDEPPCGFHNEFCPSNNYCDMLLGLTGGLLLVLSVIGLVAYRTWKYEQALDGLLWKIDFRELNLDNDFRGLNLRTNEALRGGRNSQVSLTSNNDCEFNR